MAGMQGEQRFENEETEISLIKNDGEFESYTIDVIVKGNFETTKAYSHKLSEALKIYLRFVKDAVDSALEEK